MTDVKAQQKWKIPEGLGVYDQHTNYPGRAEELANHPASMFSNAVVGIMRAEVTGQYTLLENLRNAGLLLVPGEKVGGHVAAAFRQTADMFERAAKEARDPHEDPRYWAAVYDMVQNLRARADREKENGT